VSQFFQRSSFETRYQALRKTIWVFSQLHDFIGVGSILLPTVNNPSIGSASNLQRHYSSGYQSLLAVIHYCVRHDYAKCSYEVPLRFSTSFLILGTELFGQTKITSFVLTTTISSKSIPTTSCLVKLNTNESRKGFYTFQISMYNPTRMEKPQLFQNAQ